MWVASAVLSVSFIVLAILHWRIQRGSPLGALVSLGGAITFAGAALTYGPLGPLMSEDLRNLIGFGSPFLGMLAIACGIYFAAKIEQHHRRSSNAG